MKKLSLLLLIITIFVSNLNAQIDKNINYRSGDVVYTVEQSNGKIIFDGRADYGGGIYTLEFTELGPNKYKVKDPDAMEAGLFTGVVKTATIKGKKQKFIFLYNAQNFIVDILRDDSFNYNAKLDYILGEYTDQNGKKIVINENEFIEDGIKQKLEFTTIDFASFEYGFTMTDVFHIGNKICRANVSFDKVEIYEITVGDQSDMIKSQKLYKTLKPVDSKPRFEYTKDHIVLYNYCSSAKELRIMRNEIYARHGWNFSSADLKEYFSSKPWYKPAKDNSQIVLSDLETINVEILKDEEEKMKKGK